MQFVSIYLFPSKWLEKVGERPEKMRYIALYRTFVRINSNIAANLFTVIKALADLMLAFSCKVNQ